MTDLDVPARRCVVPTTGELVDLTDLAQVAAASNYAGRTMAELKRLKEETDGILRDHLKDNAVTHAFYGDIEVEEQTGRAQYDAEAIYHGLVEAGMAPEVAEKHFHFERKVKNGTELNTLGNRHTDFAKAIVAGTTRARGRIVTHRRKGAVPAPATPKHVQERVSSHRQAETEAADIGI